MSSQSQSFVFPIKNLENSRLRLEPFEVDKHGPAFIEEVKDNPDLFKYMPLGPLSTMEDLRSFLEGRVFTTDAAICFAIMVKSHTPGEPDSCAGTVGYLATSLENCTTEIGFIAIIPRYQGTFVSKNAVGLLVTYALDPPPLGLGLRRCEWLCHAGNEASKRFATKMQFTYEGTKRFERMMPLGKPGNGYDMSSMPDIFKRTIGQSRDTAIYAHYCDEWAEKRSVVAELMNRP